MPLQNNVMEALITPTEKPEKLLENLRPRVKHAELLKNKVRAEIENPEQLEKVPGIKEFEINSEHSKGLGGSPIDQKAYAQIHTKEDVAKAFLATASGYNLVITDCSREWDLKLLRKFNPSIKEVSEPSEIFEIDQALNLEEYKDIGIKIDEDEVDIVYRQVVS